MTPEQKKEYYENGCAVGMGYARVVDGEISFPGDTPEEPVRSWSEEYAKFKAQGEFGADAFAEATAHIKKWPAPFKSWNAPKQIEWLDENHPLDKEGW
jgi:hypothetical protein